MQGSERQFGWDRARHIVTLTSAAATRCALPRASFGCLSSRGGPDRDPRAALYPQRAQWPVPSHHFNCSVHHNYVTRAPRWPAAACAPSPPPPAPTPTCCRSRYGTDAGVPCPSSLFSDIDDLAFWVKATPPLRGEACRGGPAELIMTRVYCTTLLVSLLKRAIGVAS